MSSLFICLYVLSGCSESIFVDIEGNFFRLDENQKAIEL